MENHLMTYIFFSIGIIVVAIISYLLEIYKKVNCFKNAREQEVKDKYENKITELNDEIRRQNFILADYQSRLHNKPDNPLKESEKETTDAFKTSVNTETIEELRHEKFELEKEKKQFQEKTKKLWEQSLAIHKEKERIEGMKLQIERNHLQVTDSIRYAKSIQQALLPPAELLQTTLDDFFIFYRPRDIVSGDFYWVNAKNEYLYIVAADCTGHGVPGAFMSMLGISFFNELVIKQEKPDAADILEKLRTKIIASLHQDESTSSSKDGMDLALCIVNTKKQELQYAGAYNPLLLVRNGELSEYKATKSPVSFAFEPLPFENQHIKYQNGDCIYILSDGYTDQFGGKDGRKFQLKKFREMVIKLSSERLTMTQIGEQISATFDQWKGEKNRQIDDVLVIGVRL